MTTAETAVTTQVYRVYIRATPQAIWDAITKPEWVAKYGYGGTCEYDFRPGGAYRHFPSDEMRKASAEWGAECPDVIIDGEVIEADPPHKLVQTWRMLMSPDAAAEGFTRLTFEIRETPDAGTKLTVTHELGNAPVLAAMVGGAGADTGAGGGWSWVLSDLKSLLETGATLRG